MPFDAFLIGRRIIKKHKRDILVNAQDPFETGMVGLWLKYLYGLKLVVQEHGDVLSTTHWKKESVGNFFRYYLGLFILQQADLVRVVSGRTEQAFRKRDIKNITKLPVAIDTSYFINAQADALVPTIFEPNAFVFLTVARFVPQKNLKLLLEAFKKVHEINPRARLLMVGSGKEELSLKKYIEANFSDVSGEVPIKILPWSNNVPGLMKASDAYVLTSNYEGWGRVLIEAMVCKLPIVTTDVGCAGEVVKDSQHGFIVPIGDEEVLTKAMLEISQNQDVHHTFKENLERLPVAEIPGTDISNYGIHFARSLQGNS
jgi:glycosyltransferase involved in cell wall biosynthesis